MKNEYLVSIVISILVTSAGWCVAYWSTVRRDRLSKKHDLRIQYLLEAYRRLDSAGNRPEILPEVAENLESALADIQLLGSLEQVRLAKTFAVAFAAHGSANLDQLLESLRADLRAELDLGAVEEPITHLRIGAEKNMRK